MVVDAVCEYLDRLVAARAEEIFAVRRVHDEVFLAQRRLTCGTEVAQPRLWGYLAGLAAATRAARSLRLLGGHSITAVVVPCCRLAVRSRLPPSLAPTLRGLASLLSLGASRLPCFKIAAPRACAASSSAGLTSAARAPPAARAATARSLSTNSTSAAAATTCEAVARGAKKAAMPTRAAVCGAAAAAACGSAAAAATSAKLLLVPHAT